MVDGRNSKDDEPQPTTNYPGQLPPADVKSTDEFDQALNELVTSPLEPEDVRRQLEFDIARNGRVHHSKDGTQLYIRTEPGLRGLPECLVIVDVVRNPTAGIRAVLTDIGPLPVTPDEQDEIDA